MTPDQRIAKLFDEYFDFVWRLLRRFGLSEADADDAAQRVFLTASEKLESIARGKERNFLYGVALGVFANTKRSLARRREVSDDGLASRPTTFPSPHDCAELEQAWALLDELLDQLPDKLRRVLVLAEIEQLEVAEIAALEAIPVGTAASRLRKSRESFRELLRKVEHRNPFGGPGQ
jgi:RNA polymerase sigma-70 factor, ECF subfamily